VSRAESPIRSPLARQLQGTRAGIVSRLAANAIDAAVVFGIFVAVLFAVGVVRYLVSSHRLELADPGAVLSGLLEFGITVAYLASGWAGTGRTVGKQLLGLRVVSERGRRLAPPRALSRAVICVILGGPLLLWAVVSRRNAALYDRLLYTAVVYDWSPE
jgi:uncharacterized RDD family membrane protein YckC